MSPSTKRGEVIERRLRALATQRMAWDSVALALFSLAMAGALLLLVVSWFWSGWVMALVLVPVGLQVWRLVSPNRFWNVARLVEEQFPEVCGKLVAAVQLAHWKEGRGGGARGKARKRGPIMMREWETVPRSKTGDSPRFAGQSLFWAERDTRRR